MFKRLFISIALFLPVMVGAQTVRDKMDHGDNTVSWRVYDTKGAAVTFAIEGTNLWYSIGSAVGLFDLKTNKERLYPKLGAIASAGIKTIAGDKRGGIWFGGGEGATLFKNGKFKTFTEDKGLSNNTVNKIYYASGDVWIGTENGVTRYKNGSLTVYTQKDGLCGNQVRDITSDDRGAIYFATNKGIAVLRGSQWKKYNANSGLSSNDVKAIAYDDRKGELWVAVGEMDVNSFDGKEWNTYMDIQIGIMCIMVDTQSRVWFGSEAGALKYNGFEWLSDPAKIGFPAAVVNDMYRDGKGDLYFALESGVLHMKNPYPY